MRASHFCRNMENKSILGRTLNSTLIDGFFLIGFAVGRRVLSSSNERTKSDEPKFGVNRKGERAESWPKVIF